MEFEFKVRVVVERDEGLFASREEIADQLREELEAADPGSVEGENGGVYSTTEFSVDEASR